MSTLSVKVISDVTALSYVDNSLAAANAVAAIAFNTANASFAKANVASDISPAYNTANAAFNAANNVNLGPVFTVANAAYNTSNASYNTSNAAFNAANNVNLGPVFTVANAAYNTSNTAFGVTNSAFAKANTALANGNLFIAGNVSPSSSNTYDLGSSTARWRNIYTGDLHLSNEYGNWTIVEGEDELFLYNNLKDKVYKFNLTEVEPSMAPPKKDV